jgi:hypothetical protein
MRLLERDRRDREDFEEWKALPLNERYAWKRIGIAAILLSAFILVLSAPYEIANQSTYQQLLIHLTPYGNCFPAGNYRAC